MADAVQSFVLAAPKEFDPSLLIHQAKTIWGWRAVATHVTPAKVLPVREIDPAFVAEIGAVEDEHWVARVAKVTDVGIEIVVAVAVAVEFAA